MTDFTLSDSASVQPKRVKCVMCGNDIHIGKWAGILKEGFICNDTFCLIKLVKQSKEQEDLASMYSIDKHDFKRGCNDKASVPPKGVNIDFCEKGMTSNKFKSPPPKGVCKCGHPLRFHFSTIDYKCIIPDCTCVKYVEWSVRE
jgi:hypothetical protein